MSWLHLILKKRFFVEFGATDGITKSNSWLMESQYEWSGIIAEPARRFHKKLPYSRNCSIETKAVWSKSNVKLDFLETVSPGLGTIKKFKDVDHHKRIGKTYEVETISLEDLLYKHNAPKVIDYLSIDTEGSELDILSSFKFDQYKIKIITVEHNYTQNREKINLLLTQQGYKRVLESVSLFDDWYISECI